MAKAAKKPKAWEPPKELPTEIGACIDLGIKAKEMRDAIAADLKAFDAQYTKIKDHIIKTFNWADIDGARGKAGTASVVRKVVPRVIDKEAFGKWVAKHHAWDVLYGKAVEDACKERWEDNVEIDGVEAQPVVTLKLTEK